MDFGTIAKMKGNLSPQKIRLLSVADLDWRNGHEYALQAVKILIDEGRNIEYKIVGDGPFLEAVAFTRHDLNLETEVQLILQASKKELERIFTWADLFILAVVAPGGNHGLMEAAERELPIACSDIHELLLNFREDTVSTIFPRRNSYAIAEQIRKFFSVK